MIVIPENCPSTDPFLWFDLTPVFYEIIFKFIITTLNILWGSDSFRGDSKYDTIINVHVQLLTVLLYADFVIWNIITGLNYA